VWYKYREDTQFGLYNELEFILGYPEVDTLWTNNLILEDVAFNKGTLKFGTYAL
jgi:hypothetical protein